MAVPVAAKGNRRKFSSVHPENTYPDSFPGAYFFLKRLSQLL